MRVARTADPAGYRMSGQSIERSLATSMFRGSRPADVEVRGAVIGRYDCHLDKRASMMAAGR
jgi:hypothetical protein